jgi:hypothetical protein
MKRLLDRTVSPIHLNTRPLCLLSFEGAVASGPVSGASVVTLRLVHGVVSGHERLLTAEVAIEEPLEIIFEVEHDAALFLFSFPASGEEVEYTGAAGWTLGVLRAGEERVTSQLGDGAFAAEGGRLAHVEGQLEAGLLGGRQRRARQLALRGRGALGSRVARRHEDQRRAVRRLLQLLEDLQLLPDLVVQVQAQLRVALLQRPDLLLLALR